MDEGFYEEEARRYLEGAARSLRKAELAEAAYREAAGSQVRGIDYTSAGGGGLSPDGIPNAVLRLEGLHDAAVAAADDAKEAAREARGCFGVMPDPELGVLLDLRWLCGLGWRQVADALGYSESHTRCILHERALRQLWAVLPPERKTRVPPAI